MKKLYGDKYDTNYITIYLFPTITQYKKHLSVAQKLCTVRYNDSFPPSQVQYFNQMTPLNPVYTSLILHLRDCDHNNAEAALRFFKLVS